MSSRRIIAAKRRKETVIIARGKVSHHFNDAAEGVSNHLQKSNHSFSFAVIIAESSRDIRARWEVRSYHFLASSS